MDRDEVEWWKEGSNPFDALVMTDRPPEVLETAPERLGAIVGAAGAGEAGEGILARHVDVGVGVGVSEGRYRYRRLVPLPFPLAR
jgi:hypothetical protein